METVGGPREPLPENEILVEDLTFYYGDNPDPILRNVNFQVDRGEFVVIMGESGCGKSTLCYTLNGIIPQILRGRLTGRVLITGRDTLQHFVSEMSQTIGMVFQNPETQIVSMTVAEEVAFGPENLALPEAEIRSRVEEALSIARLKGMEDRSPLNLSGGEKQALAIASVLSLRPKILVLDEPTSMLDPMGTRMVSEIIARLNRELGMTVVAVDHRIEWASEFADRIVIMNEGQIVLEGTPREIFQDRVAVEKLGFRAPQVTEAAYEICHRGLNLTQFPVTVLEAESQIRELLAARK